MLFYFTKQKYVLIICQKRLYLQEKHRKHDTTKSNTDYTWTKCC